MDYKFTSKDEMDTLELAQNIESEKFPNMVICLNGELGTGKTSPTFNIVKEYDTGELPLYHMDVYRLEDNKDNIGIKDYFNKGGITIIEWADMIEDELPEERLDINFRFVDENTRILIFKPHGKIYEDVCNSVL